MCGEHLSSSRHLAAVGLALLCMGANRAGAVGFVERAAELGLVHQLQTGLDRVGEATAMLDWAQMGIALGDIDGDGDLDVVACGGLHQNHVFRNDGETFTDVSEAAGINGTGELDRVPALGDIDGDGDLDLFIGVLDHGEGVARGGSRLYRNDGTGRFTEITTLSGTRGWGHTLYAHWSDVDLDGMLDLYLGEFCGTPNVLYMNYGGGNFVDKSVETNAAVGGSTHVTIVADLDGDRFPEILVGNDIQVGVMTGLGSNDGDRHLQGGETGFVDVSVGSGYDDESAIMGLALGDVNYDGLLDVYKTDVGSNHLLINRGWPGSGSPWSAEQDAYGVANATVPDLREPGSEGTAVGWGTALADLDLDPWLDLLVINGHVVTDHPRDQQNYLFRGLGPHLAFAFEDATELYGFLDNHDDRGLAVGDVDEDGDLDLFVTPTVGALRYYENRIEREGHGWIEVVPVSRTSAPGGFGVEVSWTDSLGLVHTRALGGDGPTASQHANVAHFGLGLEPDVDLAVRFPSGVELAFPDTPPNTRLVVVEPELVHLSARTLPAALPGVPTPVEELVVTAFAHAADGTPLGPNAAVSIEAAQLTAAGPVEHVSGNAFQRRFLAPTTPGSHRVTVTFDGWRVGIRPRVHFYGKPSPERTLVTVSPEAVRAGSDDPWLLTVTPRDDNGVALGPGHRVEARLNGPGQVGRSLTDLGDGRYVRQLRASSESNTWSIDVAIDDAVARRVARIEVAGPADASRTEVYGEPPDPGIAQSPHQLKVMYRPRDAAGRRLGPRAQVTLEVEVDPGSEPVVLRDDLRRNAQRDGDFFFVLERPEGTAPESAFGTGTLYVDGEPVVSTPFEF